MDDRVTFAVGDDHVGVVTLNRPDKLNAMDEAVFRGLHDVAAAAAAAIAAGRCRAVLVTGTGRAFSSGLDVALFGQQAAGGAPPDDWIGWLQEAFTGLEDLDVPVVAAVHGVAFGGGCQLALACHLRVAAPDTRLALLESRWALLPDLGALTRLPHLVGPSRAIDMAISGREVDAETALTWGLVDAVLDAGDFAVAARSYAARLAAGPTVALGAVPRLVRHSLTAGRETSLAAARSGQQACLASADFREAVRAASEGRPPRFEGR